MPIRKQTKSKGAQYVKNDKIKKPIKARPVGNNVTRDWSFARGGAM